MTVQVMQIQPRDQLKKIYARVVFHDDLKAPHNNASVDVFIELTDSYADIRKRAIDQAREFLQEALAADPIEGLL